MPRKAREVDQSKRVQAPVRGPHQLGPTGAVGKRNQFSAGSSGNWHNNRSSGQKRHDYRKSNQRGPFQKG